MAYTLKDQFDCRPQDEKLVMSYLASGNSAYDILSQYIDLLKEVGKFDALIKDIKEDIEEMAKDNDNPDLESDFIKQYEDLSDGINSPILG